MISSGNLSNRKQHLIKTYCFFIGEGNVYIDKKVAKNKYDDKQVVCRACEGCHKDV